MRLSGLKVVVEVIFEIRKTCENIFIHVELEVVVVVVLVLGYIYICRCFNAAYPMQPRPCVGRRQHSATHTHNDKNTHDNIVLQLQPQNRIMN